MSCAECPSVVCPCHVPDRTVPISSYYYYTFPEVSLQLPQLSINDNRHLLMSEGLSKANHNTWAHITVDFIMKLPLSRGYDSILVVCNQLTKMVHFIPTTEKTSAEGLAVLFRDYVWKLHGLPESIISNRGVQFVAGLMRELNGMLGIKTKLSTAFHPQTDGQTE